MIASSESRLALPLTALAGRVNFGELHDVPRLALDQLPLPDRRLAAQQAFDELNLRFADNAELPKHIYAIGEHYRNRKKYARARGVYQSVIADWPGTAKAMWSAQRQIFMDIDLSLSASSSLETFS